MRNPNPFLSVILPLVRSLGVELTDISFNNSAANLEEVALSIAVRKRNAAFRISLDSATYFVANPNWGEAAAVVSMFDQISGKIYDVAQAHPARQESTLCFHVTPGPLNFGKITAGLVREDLLDGGFFWGVSIHGSEGVLVIDRSLRYDGAAFVRLQRRSGGGTPLADIARQLYEDELRALRILGIPGVP